MGAAVTAIGVIAGCGALRACIGHLAQDIRPVWKRDARSGLTDREWPPGARHIPVEFVGIVLVTDLVLYAVGNLIDVLAAFDAHIRVADPHRIGIALGIGFILFARVIPADRDNVVVKAQALTIEQIIARQGPEDAAIDLIMLGNDFDRLFDQDVAALLDVDIDREPVDDFFGGGRQHHQNGHAKGGQEMSHQPCPPKLTSGSARSAVWISK